jgi:hypothetical protein
MAEENDLRIQYALLNAEPMSALNNGKPYESQVGLAKIYEYMWEQGALAPPLEGTKDFFLFRMSNIKLSVLVRSEPGVATTAKFTFSYDVVLNFFSQYAKPYIKTGRPNLGTSRYYLLGDNGVPGVPDRFMSYKLPVDPALANVMIDDVPNFQNPRFAFDEATWVRNI